MKTLIVYKTKYNTTKKCTEILKSKLIGDVDLFDLKEKNSPALDSYDNIIIGGSIYIGKIQKEVQDFCNNNIDVLKNKKIGLFICCMKEGNEALDELRLSFSKELYDIALIKDYFGGEFIISKMSFFDRLIVKMVAKTNKDTSNILEDRITEFARLFNNK